MAALAGERGENGDRALGETLGFRLSGAAGPPGANGPVWSRLLGSLLPLSYSLEIENNKEEKGEESKEVLGKKLDTRIIFPDPQESACSEKIEKAMVERCKFKLI